MMVHWIFLVAALVVGLAVGWFTRELGRAAWIAKNAIDSIRL